MVWNWKREQFKTNQISILPKEEEKIWFTNDKVIKFSTNKKFINNRVAKSKLLEKFVPEVIDSSENMYVYKYVQGNVLSETITSEILLKDLTVFYPEKYEEIVPFLRDEIIKQLKEVK